MYLNLVGINHHTAPVTVREKVSISPERMPEAVSALARYVPHGVIVSTCNRTEIYAATEGPAHNALLTFMADYFGIERTQLALARYTFTESGEKAVAHLMSTASGLDSLIVGEHEVLGQVRKALEAAEAAHMVDLPLRNLFNAAIRTGRRVREETLISRHAMSVSSVAVDLAVQRVGDLKDRRILVIGAGEAGKLVARAARERGAVKIAVASRTEARAAKLAAELHGTHITMAGLERALAAADIVVTCAGAPQRLLTCQRVQAAMAARPESPLVIIDIAVPRNVEPAVGQIANVFLHNIDELTAISESNRQQRAAESRKAEQIINEEVARFMEWWATLGYRSVVAALMTQAENIRTAHLGKTLRKLRPLTQEEQQDLDSMTRAIVTKIMLGPIEWLKTNGNGEHAAVIQELFGLPEVKRE